MNSVGVGVGAGGSTFSCRGEVEEGVLKTWFYSAVRDEDLSFFVLEGRARGVGPFVPWKVKADTLPRMAPIHPFWCGRSTGLSCRTRVDGSRGTFSRHDGSWDLLEGGPRGKS